MIRGAHVLFSVGGFSAVAIYESRQKEVRKAACSYGERRVPGGATADAKVLK